MLTDVGNFIRMLVRPTVTIALVIGVIYGALSRNLEAAKEIGIYAAVALTFWFSDRTQHDNSAELGDK